MDEDLSKRPTTSPLKLLQRQEVLARGYAGSPSALGRLMDEHGFPKPIRLNERIPRWIEDECEQWAKAKMAERDSAA